MSKHTPGPWEVNPDAAEVGQASPPHFTVVQFSSGWTKQEQADARLIATAPDMLKALKDAACTIEDTACDCLHENDGYHSEDCAGLRHSIPLLKLIAKAEGRS